MKHWIIWVLLIIMSCSDDEDRCINSGISTKVEKGKTYCIDEFSSIQILDIDDSYCPCYAECIWEGEAMVTAMYHKHDEEQDTIDIYEITDLPNPISIAIDTVITDGACDPMIKELWLIIN